MIIYIAHLYYDLMNLYGEVGNIKALKKSITDENIKVVIDNISIDDEIDFNKYDLIYIGSGTRYNEELVLKHLLKYKDALKEYIESNKFILSTGNSIELFGKSLDKLKALNIFDYISKTNDSKIVGDLILNCDLIKDNIIGFQNRNTVIENKDYSLFDIDNIGIKYNNFYGMYLLGPVLVRNPKFHKYFIKELIKNKYPKFKFKKLDLTLDTKAYNKYMENYH